MKRKIIYNPIGSVFEQDGKRLKVVEVENYKTCNGCYYSQRKNGKRIYKKSCYEHLHACTSAVRKDGKQVIFKLINETE